MIWAAGDIAERAYALPDDVEKTIDEAESLVFAVAERRLADATALDRRPARQTLDRLEELYARGESITGIPTGYYELDELLSGLQPSCARRRRRAPVDGQDRRSRSASRRAQGSRRSGRCCCSRSR